MDMCAQLDRQDAVSYNVTFLAQTLRSYLNDFRSFQVAVRVVSLLPAINHSNNHCSQHHPKCWGLE
eukprot:3299237-Amphidinium_carterae.1